MRVMTRREKRVRRRVATLAALTVAALMTACAGAQAKTVQVGSPLSGNFTPIALPTGDCFFYCPPGPPAGPMTIVQGTLSQPGTNTSSPVEGTVISYRLAAADGTFAVQITRSYVYRLGFVTGSLASSRPTRIVSSGVSPPIATKLAVKEGDQVAIRNFGDGDRLGFASPYPSSILAFPSAAGWYPPLEDGAHARSSNFFIGGEIGVQATVRYCRVPKLKGKTLKAARKTLSAADCTLGKVHETNQVHDRSREVISQSVQPYFAISDTQPIKLWLSR
jgi:hypothetical protein